jgi:hypothetical protein
MKTSNLSLLSMLLAGFFIIAAIVVHLLHPELNFLQYSLSNYAIVKYGLILKIGLCCIGISQIITALIIKRNYQKSSGTILLIIAGLGGIGAGIFPMDPGPNRTVIGIIHIISAFVEFLLFPIAVLQIGFELFRGRVGMYTRITGIATMIIFLLVFLPISSLKKLIYLVQLKK